MRAREQGRVEGDRLARRREGGRDRFTQGGFEVGRVGDVTEGVDPEPGCDDDLELIGADVDAAVEEAGFAPLVGRDAGYETHVARADRRAPEKFRHGLRRSPVVSQGSEVRFERPGVGADEVGVDPAGAGIGCADQVVAE